MHFQELRAVLNRRPFSPLRLYVSGGETFDIVHPELCMVGLHDAFIGLQAPGVAEPAFERFTLVDLAHIIRVEPLPVAIR